MRASTFELQGALAGLHEQGKVDRYSDKPEEAAKLALEALKAAAPNLVRAPVAAPAGPASAPPQQQPNRSGKRPF